MRQDRLHPEFGVKDANKVNEDVGAGRFGMMFGDFWNMAWINDVKVKNPDFEWGSRCHSFSGRNELPESHSFLPAPQISL